MISFPNTGYGYHTQRKQKKKEVNTVVELDAYKQKLQAYESPLQEVRDSL